MSKNNYKEFISDFTNYLYAIKNLSELYVKGIVGTVHQFLEFINIYKFDQQFESVEDICLNDIRTLTNNDFDSIKSFITNQWSLLDYNKFKKLNDYGEYPIDFLFVLMTLLSVQEKTNRSDVYMFGKIIDELLEDELDIFKIVATAGFGGK